MLNTTSLLARLAIIAVLTVPAVTAAAAPGKDVCLVRNADASIRSMIPAERPAIAVAEGLAGTAVVQVDLDDRGGAHNATIVKSSGSSLLDAAARSSALKQRYAPEIHDCANVSGSYRVVVEFADHDSR
jgi:TonB family protein